MTLSARLIKPALVTATAAAVAITAGCSGGSAKSGHDTKSEHHKVTISAPRVVKNAGKVPVKVTGPKGANLEIYGYSSDWSKKQPTCASSDDPVETVQLDSGGTKTVQVDPEKAGRWWWVITDTKHKGKTSKCGASSTLIKTKSDFTFTGPESPTDALNGVMHHLPRNKPVHFWVNTESDPPDPMHKGWPVTVKWLGPYNSTPEAKNSCKTDAKKPAKLSTSGHVTKARGGIEYSQSSKFKVTPKKAGVYAVVATSPTTKWTAAATTGCGDTAPYLVVK